jgi:hypothetical protein
VAAGDGPELKINGKVRYAFRQPRFPIVCAVGNELISAGSAVSFQRQVERLDFPDDKVLDIVDARGEGWAFHVELMIVSPLTLKKRWTKSAVIRLFNESENARRTGRVYPETSVSGRKKLAWIITEVAALAAYAQPNKPRQRIKARNVRPPDERQRYASTEMILDPHSAAQFIQGYKTLLLEIDAQVSGNGARGVVEKLVAAREQLRKDRSLLKKGLDRMTAKNLDISSAVIQAVEDLQIERWIYLRDTRHHSIFIHPKGHSAFGVVGLTDPIRDVVGGSGVVMETGLVRYCGRFVCDGLISGPILLGPNYRKSFGRTFSSLKAQGHFHVTYEA